MCAPGSSTSGYGAWSSRRTVPSLELSTPIGAALLTALADDWGPQPAMAVSDEGVGAALGDPEGRSVAVASELGES